MSDFPFDIIIVEGLSPSRRQVVHHSAGSVLVINHPHQPFLLILFDFLHAHQFACGVSVHKDVIRSVFYPAAHQDLSQVSLFSFDLLGPAVWQVVVFEHGTNTEHNPATL